MIIVIATSMTKANPQFLLCIILLDMYINKRSQVVWKKSSPCVSPGDPADVTDGRKKIMIKKI